jgi:tRNA pseudouridine55 synthase
VKAARPAGPDGLVVVDKPADWTSHDVVAKSRGLLGTRKVGHAGTLDPDATGVLLLGVGRATKLLRFLSPLGKSYVGEVVLGAETSTLDSAGEVIATHDMSEVTLAEVQRASERFVGEIEQVPPMVSAVKVGGKRLHELARQGIEVERKPRPVTIHSLTVGPGPEREPNVYRIEVSCSSGTYVRTLAADLGHALGGGAHLRNLRRTSVGPFTLDDAVPLDAVSPDVVRPMVEAVRHLDRVVASDEVAAAVAVGKVLGPEQLAVTGDGPWAVVDGAGDLLAVYERFRGETAKPAVVIAAR